jgi:hypothetical protein
MTALLRLLLDLLRLRIGPQDLPWSVPLARALVVLSLAFDLATTVLLGAGSAALPRLLLSALLLLGVPWLLLAWRGRGGRYVQTLTALAGTGLLFKLAMLPLALAIADLPLPQTPEQLAPAQVLVGWATLALLSWRIVVNAHIYRHALDLRFGWSVLLVLGVLVVELLLAQAFVVVAR